MSMLCCIVSLFNKIRNFSLDIMPRNVTAATDIIKHINLMPVYGLNVYSMLKHDTLVLTKSAVDVLESKLLMHLHKNDVKPCTQKYKVNQV
jgi:large subunit ribosomal protein L4